MRELIDASKLERTVRRISHEIIERNNDLNNVVLLGVLKNGVPLAKMIKENIEKFEKVFLLINLRYRVTTLRYKNDLSDLDEWLLCFDVSSIHQKCIVY